MSEKPVFVFSSPTAALSELLKTIDFSFLGLPGTAGSDVITDIATTWGTDKTQAVAKIRHLLGVMNVGGSLDMLFRTWPPATATDENAKKGFVFLLSLVVQVPEPLPLIQTIGNLAVPDFKAPSLSVAAAFTARLKGDVVGWGTIAPSGAFEFVVDGQLKQDGVVSGIKCDQKGKLTLTNENGKKIGTWELGEVQKKIWEKVDKVSNLPPLALSLCGAAGDPPDVLLSAVYDMVTADDMVFVRSLPHSARGLNEKDGKRLARSLMEVFAYAGKVNQLLVAVVAADLGQPFLKPGELLRANSLLTNMLKLFYSKYGRNFYENVLKKMIEYVDSTGDIGLSKQDEVDSERVKKMLATVMNCLLSSQEYLSPQIHHLASIVKMVASARFNEEVALYNALAGMFYLRFVSTTLANPLAFDPKYQSQTPQPAFLQKVMIPFSRITQMILNGKLFTEKEFGRELVKLNDFVETQVQPLLFQYLWALAVPPETPPVYEAPSKERLVKRLKYIIQWVAKTSDYFPERFRDVSKDAKANHPISWNLQSFMLSFFKESHECKEHK